MLVWEYAGDDGCDVLSTAAAATDGDDDDDDDAYGFYELIKS